MLRKVAVCGILSLLCIARSGKAQETTATISGTVADSTGAVLPGAKLVLLNEDTGVSRTVTTDAAGRYTAPSLSLGNYRVTASLEGFQTAVHTGIVLTVARHAVVDLQLAVGTVAESVEVTGEAPLVQTTNSTMEYLVTDTTVRDMPLNGRDMTELVLLSPGVTFAPYGPHGTAQDGFGKHITISGMRGEDNAYLLDGSYINDFHRNIPTGPSGSLLGADTVREFTVLTSAYGAQYGRALGGVLNAVTKSGNNEFHGGAYDYFRDSALDARDFFDRKNHPGDPRLPPYRRNQFGGTLGGPIRRDKTFFFGAYEGSRQTASTTVIDVVPDSFARQGLFFKDTAHTIPDHTVIVSPLIMPYLILFPQGNGALLPGGLQELNFQPTNNAREDFGQGRIDHQFSASDSLFGRYTVSNASYLQVLDYPGSSRFPYANDRFLTLAETHILSPTMLNTARFSFIRVNPVDDDTTSLAANLDPKYYSVPSSHQPPGFTPGSGVTPFAPGTNGKQLRITNRFTYQDDLNLTKGSHSLQFGGMLERLQFNILSNSRPNGTWIFSNLDSFLQDIPSGYRGTPPDRYNPEKGIRNWFFGLYLQDDWRVTPKLTLNLGLRYEPYTVPTEVNNKISNLRNLSDPKLTLGNPYFINQSWKNFGPRFGFAWSPFHSGKTSVRGGFGVMYIPNDSSLIFTNITRTGPYFEEFNISNAALLKQFFPDALGLINNYLNVLGITNVQVTNYSHNKTPRALQYNLNVQQQVGQSTVLTVGFVGTRGLNLQTPIQANQPVATFDGLSLAVSPTATLNNPHFDNLTYTGPAGDSRYNGMTVALERRFAAGLQLNLAYTYSRAISTGDSSSIVDDSGSGSGTVFYAWDLKAEKGLSGYNQKNVLRLTYSYDLPFGHGWSGIAGRIGSGWQLTGIISLQSGQPFPITGGGTSAFLNGVRETRVPNVVSSFPKDKIILGSPKKSPSYFDAAAFTPPPTLYELGNVGRDTLNGPGVATWDASLGKVFSLTEKYKFQFRGEFFNLLNRTNFGKPSGAVFTGNFGAEKVSGTAGRINNSLSGVGRQIQLGFRLIF